MTTPNTPVQLIAQAQQLGLPRLDCQMLLLAALGRDPKDRAWLIAHDKDAIPPEAMARWQHLSQRRLKGEPVAYLLGQKEFFGLTLAVDARVLIPRPDTETLVQWALDLLASMRAPARVVDLGTGSGAIALVLASSRTPGLSVTATDASTDALSVASANATHLGLNVRFAAGNWLDAVAGERFDLIVSNPPYIAEGDHHLAALVHEPITALTSGPDGLDDIRTIVAQAPAHLNPQGWLILEHGHDQSLAVRTLLEQAGFADVASRTDLAGIERCTAGQWSEQR